LKNSIYIIFLTLISISILTNCADPLTKNIKTLKEDTSVSLKDVRSPEIRTFFLVRHAEKALTGNNPSLTKEGQARAEELARLLEEVPIDAVYSTNYNRTMETVMPIATAKNLPIEKYDPSNLTDFVASFQRPSQKKKILIVGHSNTTPALINIFTNSNQYSNLSEKQYDNMFLLSSIDGKVVDILTIKYGNKSE